MIRMTWASATIAAGLLATVSVAQQQEPSPVEGPARLQSVASFDHQVTGVTVAQDGRIFVNFPR